MVLSDRATSSPASRSLHERPIAFILSAAVRDARPRLGSNAEAGVFDRVDYLEYPGRHRDRFWKGRGDQAGRSADPDGYPWILGAAGTD
jgi:hypothetical protein